MMMIDCWRERKMELLLLLAMVATNILSFYHLSSSRSLSPSSLPPFRRQSQQCPHPRSPPPPTPHHLLHHLPPYPPPTLIIIFIIIIIIQFQSCSSLRAPLLLRTLPHRLCLLRPPRPPPPLHLRQIPPKFECLRFTSAKFALNLSISQLLTIARAAPGAASIKLALDVAGDTATLAAKLKQMANVTVITTTTNIGFPYSEVAARTFAAKVLDFLGGRIGGLGLRCREGKGKYEVDWHWKRCEEAATGSGTNGGSRRWWERRQRASICQRPPFSLLLRSLSFFSPSLSLFALLQSLSSLSLTTHLDLPHSAPPSLLHTPPTASSPSSSSFNPASSSLTFLFPSFPSFLYPPPTLSPNFLLIHSAPLHSTRSHPQDYLQFGPPNLVNLGVF